MVNNRLGEIRKSRGISAADLARQVEVSRQTIHAIESGAYVPNTEVALKLARVLEVTVDHLFSLPEVTVDPWTAVEFLSPAPPRAGQPVRVCQVGEQWVSFPANAYPYYLPEADGLIEQVGRVKSRARVSTFARPESSSNRLLLAGCDPATKLLTGIVEKLSGVEILSAAASSKLALSWLQQGKVHIAGSHLEDPKTGEFNLPYLREHFPHDEFTVVTFARWEEGLVTASGNPKAILEIGDLGRKNVKLANREPGSGSRALLDKLLKKGGLKPAQVTGYTQIADGHLAAAYCVANHTADVCLATRSAAQAFGLDFIPVHSERYDLIFKRETGALPAVQAFLDTLQRASLRRKLESLAGYDTGQTGTLLT